MFKLASSVHQEQISVQNHKGIRFIQVLRFLTGLHSRKIERLKNPYYEILFSVILAPKEGSWKKV